MTSQKNDSSNLSIHNHSFRKAYFRRNRRSLLIAVILCICALISGLTVAYFSAQETAYNVITTPELDLVLHEETTGGAAFPEEGFSDVMPGGKIDKIVYLENAGTVDYYARIALSMSVAGEKLPLDTELIQLDINEQNWIRRSEQGKDYFYYSRSLLPGECTENLFTTVTFSQSMGNEYKRARVEVVVEAQAVQSKNNGTSALDAQGWANAADQ